MKQFKRLFAVMIALLLVIPLFGTRVLAADDDPEFDETITVSGLDKDDVAHFYKVIEWVGTTDPDNVGGWKATDAFKTVLTKDKLVEVLVGTPDDPDTTEDDSVPPTGITAELAGELQLLAASSVADVTVGDDGKAVLDVAADNDPDTEGVQSYGPGMYMAIITPADSNYTYNPVFVSSQYDPQGTKNSWAVQLNTASYDDDPKTVAKKTDIPLVKTAKTEQEIWADQSEYTTAVGDTVTFTVKTTIPGYKGFYEHPTFEVTDTLENMELVTTSVTVKSPTSAADKYTVTATTAGYTLSFDEDYLLTLQIPTPIEIEYKAVVSADAATYGVNEEVNEVYIKFSNNPIDSDDYGVKKDTTEHYTFSLDASGIAAGESETIRGKKTSEIVKIGLDAAGRPITQKTETSDIGDPEVDKWTSPLEGAVFGLFTEKDEDSPYYPWKMPATDPMARDTTPATQTTTADGRMNFAGLDAGTYYLKEISAPAGFIKDPDWHTVEIIAHTEEITVTEWWNGSAWVSTKPESGVAKEVTYQTEILKSYEVKVDGKTAAEYTFTNDTETNSHEIQWDEAELIEHPYPFSNTQGTELPSTGGMGTTLFYIFGGILVVGAGILLVSRQRMMN